MFTTDAEARAELVHLVATLLLDPHAKERRPELFNVVSKVSTYRNRPLSEILTPEDIRVMREYAAVSYDAWAARHGLTTG